MRIGCSRSATTGLNQMGMGPMLGCTLFWCGITGVFMGIVGHSFYRAYDAQRRYVQTDGMVLSSEVRTGHDDNGTTYGFGLRYRYQVQGVDFESNRYAFGAGTASDGYNRSAALVRRYPAGAHLPVFYDPAKPAEAVVDRRPDPMMTFLVLFLQPFIMVGVGMLGACVWLPLARRALRRFIAGPVSFPLRVPTWGELRQEEGGRYVLGSRPDWSAVLLVMAVGYGVTCALSIVVVIFFFGGFSEPRMSAVVAAIALAVGVGVVSAVCSVRARRRRPRLVVDTFNRKITLERSGENTDVRFADLSEWLVGQIENPRRVRQEGAPLHVPLLSVRTSNGIETPVHVFQAGTEAAVIAARIAEVLAGLTGHRAAAAGGAEADADDPVAGGSLVSAALAALRQQKERIKTLRDLT